VAMTRLKSSSSYFYFIMASAIQTFVYRISTSNIYMHVVTQFLD